MGQKALKVRGFCDHLLLFSSGVFRDLPVPESIQASRLKAATN